MTTTTTLAGLRVLVVEDEFLVALSLEEDLREAGCEIIGPIGDLAAATDAARAEKFDIALLDVNLKGEKIFAVADDLKARGVAFVLLSGYGKMDLPPRFHDAPRLAKPYDPQHLLREIERLVGNPR
jgi:DNA-binding response OmpR family regulator